MHVRSRQDILLSCMFMWHAAHVIVTLHEKHGCPATHDKITEPILIENCKHCVVTAAGLPAADGAATSAEQAGQPVHPLLQHIAGRNGRKANHSGILGVGGSCKFCGSCACA